MKKSYVLAVAFAMTLYCAPIFAQHGHGVGGGGSMGPTMSANGSSHANSHAGNTGMGGGSGPATAHGQTMDQILTKNTNLANMITHLTGATTAQDACANFKNLGQCVAAAHVSNNLHISFTCLKDDMTGTLAAKTDGCPDGTGSSKMSLGKSIQALHPASDSKTESKKATQQADQDLKDAASNS
jgi:hypothetical protein